MIARLSLRSLGIQRLPALLFYHPEISLPAANLNFYEILNNEPLHDISNHIKNIYEELPHLVEKTDRKEVEATIKASFNGAEAKNAANYRKSLLIVTHWFLENYQNHFLTEILLSLTEIQQILYAPEDRRSVTKVFRLTNLTFIHALQIKKFQCKIKNTERKFFGSYYHSLISHSPQQYRLFSGRSINAEKEEATFQHLKTSAKLTSNHHPANVISNAFIRGQSRNMLKEGEKLKENDASIIRKIYAPIKIKLSNTVVSFEWIQKFFTQFQRLLERQADYLLQGPGVWWREVETGVEFFDHELAENTAKKLHHFRSSTLKSESEFLTNCWQKCLNDKNVLIPAWKIKEDQTPIILTTLAHFENTENDVDFGIKQKNTSTETQPNVSNDKSFYSHTSTSKQEVETMQKSNPTPPLSASPVIIMGLPKNSTPIRKSSLPPVSPALTPIAKNDKIIPQAPKIMYLKPKPISKAELKTTEGWTKTATLLIKVFGEQAFIIEFDRCRKNLKRENNTSNRNVYRDIIARVEVKLANKYDELKSSFSLLNE